VYSITGVQRHIGVRNTGLPSTAFWNSLNSVPWRNFSKSTFVVFLKVRHVSPTTPHLGVICYSFGKTWYNLRVQNLTAIPEIWMGLQIFEI